MPSAPTRPLADRCPDLDLDQQVGRGSPTASQAGHHIARRRRAPKIIPHRLLVLTASIAPILAVVGCASPGPPQPPTLHLPTPVSNLSASRVGDQVLLSWTTPSETTDNLPVSESLTAELCRSSPASTPTCLPRLSVKPGAGTISDPLPPTLLADPVRLISYRIQIFNNAGRSAGPSTEASAPSGPALPAIRDLQLTAVERAVRLAWQSQPPPATVELDRVDLSPRPASKPKPGTASRQPGFNLEPAPEVRVHLRVQEQSASGSDRSGATDTAVTEGSTYRYTAQRLRVVTVAGHRLELRSFASAPATVTLRDIFPPRPPQGLAAVPTSRTSELPSAANIDASDSKALSIDLSWEPNSEPDLAGYLVYRAPVSSIGTPGSFTRLTPQPVPAPAFRDTTVARDTRYAYRITAIDTSGNESTPGAPVQESSP